MKKTPSTENQLVKENQKLRDALCSITGQMEGEAEVAMKPYFGKTPDLKKATEIYRDLIRLHKASPLGRVSKVWVKEWREKLDDCYDRLDQARYDVEDVNQYLDDSLVIVE